MKKIKTSHAGENEIRTLLETNGEINRDFQAHFLKTLVTKKEEAEKALHRLIDNEKEKRDRFSADDLIDELDHAEREILAHTHSRLIERKIKEIKKIEDLILRTQNDEEFGLCEECGERISEDRLIIVPEATRCVPCQQELEKLESRSGLSTGRSSPSQWKKDAEWEHKEGFHEEEGFIIQTDMDYTSFLDMEEIELDDNQQ